jgi:hypothetical protein
MNPPPPPQPLAHLVWLAPGYHKLFLATCRAVQLRPGRIAFFDESGQCLGIFPSRLVRQVTEQEGSDQVFSEVLEDLRRRN